MSPRTAPSNSSRAGLVIENLAYLDELLQRAFERAQKLFDREDEGGSRPWEYRGLHVSREDAKRLLAQPPGTPQVSATRQEPQSVEVFNRSPIWGEFGHGLGLSAFDQAVTMIALAPEVDLRYERLYAYLQDDITRRRPTVSLALDILSPSAEAKVEWRARFAAGSPLIRAGLLELSPDPSRANSSSLDYTLQLDGSVVAYLTGDNSLDARLARCSEIVEPSPCVRMERPDLEALASMVVAARRDSAPLTVCFHGPRGSHQREAAEWIAFTAGAPLLIVDLAASPDSEHTLEAASRYAALRGAILYFAGVDTLLSESQAPRLALFQRIIAPAIAILNTSQPWSHSVTGAGYRGVLNVPFAFPEFTARKTAWFGHFKRSGFPDDPALVDRLAGSFVLSHGQIAEAAAESALRLRWLGALRPSEPLTTQQYQNEAIAAARSQAGHDLASLARKVEAVYRWQDIVLPDEVEKQLREISSRARLRSRVLEEWGFGQKLSQANGVSALFTGPSGAGKSMAAEVIANDLALDLYKIDLSVVVSKYIGETEKNLERIFAAAERSNAILFFDEADALFGKRSEVHDAHDRYANIEVSYLLQRMEGYEGIAILATNLRGNLDEAFVRRIAYTVRFALPQEAERLQIWEKIWPSKELLAPGVDLRRLAAAFKLSGGNIRNVALAASFFAAARGGRVTQDDLLLGVQREYEKVGKTVALAELRDAAAPEAAA